MRTLYGGLSLLGFVLFFACVFLAVSGKYPGNAIAGIAAIVCLLAAYFLNRLSRRFKTS